MNFQDKTVGTTSTIRKGDWKMVYWYKDGKKELFNLNKDISEDHDRSTEYPERVEELSKKLGSFLREVDAQRPSFKSTGEIAPWPDEL